MSYNFIDIKNRLIIRRKGKRLSPQGYFSLDSENRLVYWLNEPVSWRTKYQLPDKIVFSGVWKINSNYDLELELEQKEQASKKERLTLKGKILSCEKDHVAFEIQTINHDGSDSFYLLKLSGRWQADEYNRITFLITKKGQPDTLTFQGSWQLNENQQVTYIYEKMHLKTKSKVLHTLTFNGHWQITSSNRLTYILSTGANSRFDFKVQLESPNIRPKEGSIKYRLGIGIRQPKREKAKIITLYGTWKFSRKVGLFLEMSHSDGEISRLEFGAEVNFDKTNHVIFKLTSKNGELLGLSLTFTHKLLKELDGGGELFLRLKRYREESGIDAGIKIPW